MKLFLFFSFFVFALGCNNPPASDDPSSENESAKGGEQWLTWDGNGKMPHIVLVSGDEEYRSEEAMPQMAKILSKRHGFKCTVLFSQDPEKPGIVNPNYAFNIAGLEQLQSADLLVLFTRFRALPDDQMQYIDDYLKSGKPVLGIRTATHAFKYEKGDSTSHFLHYGNYYQGEDAWKDGFGRLVMGEHWVAHHGKHGHQSTKGLLAPGAEEHPVVNGIEEGTIWGPTDVYRVRLPLPGDSQPIVLGQVTERELPYDENDRLLGMRMSDHELPEAQEEDTNGKTKIHDQNDPMMPIAWTKTYQHPDGQPGKCFATTIGASTDLLAEGTRRMMVNAAFWCLGLEVPEKADVRIVGQYEPTRFQFHDDAYWEERNVAVSDLK
ncbi:MAG: ThuA domain-containing protein [Bacteroidota bacterium]